MSQKEFIEKHANRIKEGGAVKLRRDGYNPRSSSLEAGNDVIYSYGSHYPLLFRIETPKGRRLMVCNNRGYSPTTGKHISMASRFADVSAPLPRVNTFGNVVTDYRGVLEALESQRDILMALMNAKKRKNTQVYKYLQYDYDNTVAQVNTLRA